MRADRRRNWTIHLLTLGYVYVPGELARKWLRVERAQRCLGCGGRLKVWKHADGAYRVAFAVVECLGCGECVVRDAESGRRVDPLKLPDARTSALGEAA